MKIDPIEILDDDLLKSREGEVHDCNEPLKSENPEGNCCYRPLNDGKPDKIGNYHYMKSERITISRGGETCEVCSDAEYEVISAETIDEVAPCDMTISSWVKIDEISCDCEPNETYYVFEIYERELDGGKIYKAYNKTIGAVVDKIFDEKPGCRVLNECPYTIEQEVCEYDPETGTYRRNTYIDEYINGEWVRTTVVYGTKEYDTKIDCLGGVVFRWVLDGNICDGLTSYPTSKLQFADEETPDDWHDMNPEQRRKAQNGDYKILDDKTAVEVTDDDLKPTLINDDNAKDVCGYELEWLPISYECDGVYLVEIVQKVYRLRDEKGNIIKTIYLKDENGEYITETRRDENAKPSEHCYDLVKLPVCCCDKELGENVTCSGDCKDDSESPCECYECDGTTRYKIKCYQYGYYLENGDFEVVGEAIERGMPERSSRECGAEWIEDCIKDDAYICLGDDLYNAQFKGTKKCHLDEEGNEDCEDCIPNENATPKIGNIKEENSDYCKNGGFYYWLQEPDCFEYQDFYEIYNTEEDRLIFEDTVINPRQWRKILVSYDYESGPYKGTGMPEGENWVKPTEDDLANMLRNGVIKYVEYTGEDEDEYVYVLVDTECVLSWVRTEPKCKLDEEDGKYYFYYQEQLYINGEAQEEPQEVVFRFTDIKASEVDYDTDACKEADGFWDVVWVVDGDDDDCKEGYEGEIKTECEEYCGDIETVIVNVGTNKSAKGKITIASNDGSQTQSYDFDMDTNSTDTTESFKAEFEGENKYNKYKRCKKYRLENCEWVYLEGEDTVELIEENSKDCGYVDPNEPTPPPCDEPENKEKVEAVGDPYCDGNNWVQDMIEYKFNVNECKWEETRKYTKILELNSKNCEDGPDEPPCDDDTEEGTTREVEGEEYCNGNDWVQKITVEEFRDCKWKYLRDYEKVITANSDKCVDPDPSDEEWTDNEDFIYVPVTEEIENDYTVSCKDRYEGAWNRTDMVRPIKVTRKETEYKPENYSCIGNVVTDSCDVKDEIAYETKDVWNGFSYYGQENCETSKNNEMYSFPNEPSFVPAKPGSKKIKYTTDGYFNGNIDDNPPTLHYNYNIDEVYDFGEYGELCEHNLKAEKIEFLNGLFDHNHATCYLLSADMSEVDTSKVQNFSNMFFNQSKLRWVNLRNLDTSSLRHCDYCFNRCSSLVNVNLSTWNFDLRYNGDNVVTDVGGVCSCSHMFDGCTSLVSVDLSSFAVKNNSDVDDTESYADSKWYDTSDMFKGCTNLRYIKCHQSFKHYLIEGWKVTGKDYNPNFPEGIMEKIIWDTETSPKPGRITGEKVKDVYGVIYGERRETYLEALPGDLIAFCSDGSNLGDHRATVIAINITNPDPENTEKFYVILKDFGWIPQEGGRIIPVGITVSTMYDNEMIKSKDETWSDTISVMSLYNMSLSDKENGCQDFYGENINIASYSHDGIKYRTKLNYVGLYSDETLEGNTEVEMKEQMICKFGTDGYHFDKKSLNETLSYYNSADTNNGPAYLLPVPYTSELTGEGTDPNYYTPNTVYYSDSDENLFNEAYGIYNTNALYEINKEGNDAIQCCKEYRVELFDYHDFSDDEYINKEHWHHMTDINNWHLPSAYELGYLYHNRKYIKEAIEKLHGFMIPASYIDVDFVSSTFYDKDTCYKLTKLGRLELCPISNTQANARAFLHINDDIIISWTENI